MSALVFESYWQNKAACEDAERAYYQKLSGCKSQEEASEKTADEEVDLFASDEDTAEKPADKPSKPSTPAPAPTPAPAQAAEAPVWPNKAECSEAEAKFHAQLAQVGGGGPGGAAETQGR